MSITSNRGRTRFATYLAACLVGALVCILLGRPALAATIVVTIGADDGFGGTQGPPRDPGQLFSPLTEPGLALPPSPTPYVDEAGLNLYADTPFTPFVFEFNFDWDTTSLQTIDAATVTVQSGSVARRTDGSGFGFAAVSADVLDLGELLTVGTGAAGSNSTPNDEETVKSPRLRCHCPPLAFRHRILRAGD